MTDNMLDDNVLGSVDNQENVELDRDQHDPRRRRRRDTVLHPQPQPNSNQVRDLLTTQLVVSYYIHLM